MGRELKKLSFRRELLEILGIFILGATINYIFWCEGCLEDSRIFLVNVIISGSFWALLWKGSQYIVWYLDSVVTWVEHPVKRFLLSFSSIIVYTTLVIYGLDLIIDVFIFDKPVSLAIQSLNYASWTFAVLITLAINTFMHGRAFLLEWRQSAIDFEKLKTEQVFTQFQSLKNQVNPHFLFNSLNALSSLVYEDQDKAVEFIRKLSQVYRYVLDRKDEEVIPLEEELKFLENFVFLQKIRFGDNLRFVVEGTNKNGYLPPMALQMLVENAIKHNVISESHHLEIKVKIGEDHCVVSNNVKEKKSKDSTGIGLSNLVDRYGYLTDKKVIISNENEVFEVKVPLLTMKA
ncbi:MAG: hypothetical protein Tsb0034_28290 [Ekhidna sp.]